MKRIVVIGAAVAILGGIWTLWYIGGKAGDTTGAELGFKKIDQPDTDSDQLADPEEELWQTDVNNPDSDGDGTPDGAELAALRDPRRPGPGDQLADPYDRTRALVRNALERQARPLINLPPTVVVPTRYTETDLTLAPDSATSTTEVYAATLAATINTFGRERQGNEVELLLSYLDRNDPSALAKLAAAAQRHALFTQALRLISVPPVYAALHLEVVNRAGELATTAGFMSKVGEEPLVALQSAQLYHQKYFEFLNALVPLKRELSARSLALELDAQALWPLTTK